jgi:hypothetical protein
LLFGRLWFFVNRSALSLARTCRLTGLLSFDYGSTVDFMIRYMVMPYVILTDHGVDLERHTQEDQG